MLLRDIVSYFLGFSRLLHMNNNIMKRTYKNSLKNKNTSDCVREIERLEKILINQDYPRPMILAAYVKIGIVHDYVISIEYDLAYVRHICRKVLRVRNAATKKHGINLLTPLE